VAGKLLAFGVLTGIVQCREYSEWLGNGVFLCNYVCCTVLRVL
jgi:hypothetical protein